METTNSGRCQSIAEGSLKGRKRSRGRSTCHRQVTGLVCVHPSKARREKRHHKLVGGRKEERGLRGQPRPSRRTNRSGVAFGTLCTLQGGCRSSASSRRRLVTRLSLCSVESSVTDASLYEYSLSESQGEARLQPHARSLRTLSLSHHHPNISRARTADARMHAPEPAPDEQADGSAEAHSCNHPMVE